LAKYIQRNNIPFTRCAGNFYECPEIAGKSKAQQEDADTLVKPLKKRE
jgi:hypothetical protein